MNRDPWTQARATDPATSRAAAVDNQKRVTHRERILRVIAEAGQHGLTQDEVRRLTSIPQPWKRISDLKDDGHIKVLLDPWGEPVTRTLESGRKGQVYVTVEPAGQMALAL